ncbi:MAG: hypothetical protein XD81_0553 [Bacteroidetes bacterium 38_7]|nr:MAG: hypothetical protein XD81_0553 [Bacteroidetes bacterium 38_7]HAL65578.1 hypothetical protein [Bacteroidales bacterium]HQQ02152.1 SAM-dependent chlorinase/fluorinase [Bacteroidales bacterium]
MPIITLTSDWGLKDHYLAAVKAAILSRMPEVKIIDISHQIPPFDLNQASFIIRNCWKAFPQGTVHIIGINTEAGIKSPHIALETEGHYFIGADNGIFSLIFDKEPEHIIELEIIQDSEYFTFSTRDVFVKAALYLLKGNPIEGLGLPRLSLNPCTPFQPVINQNSITGKVIYVDVYENVFTNISREMFQQIVKGRRFHIELGYSRNTIHKISEAYSDVPEGEILALFSSTGLLQIAINRGNASGLLGLGLDDNVRIVFE